MRIKELFVSVILVAFLMVSLPYRTHAAVIFNEIAWMGTTESSYAEWVELYNDGDSEVDLSGAKIYEDGGKTLMFTLTKKISARDYLLVERVTQSVPDPVKGISDEVGSFGGSGLSNQGEYLMLKDKSGALLDEINALKGWPAGDAESKYTMQRTHEGKWITAKATPGNGIIGSATGAGTQRSVELSDAPSAHASYASLATIRDNGELRVSAGRDRLVTLGNPVSFEAKYERGISDAQGINYTWSFGDGDYANGSKATKMYYVPGEYAVVLNVTDGKREAASRVKIKVVPLDGHIVVRNGNVGIENISSHELNVGGWKAENENGSYIFPSDTILFPKSVTLFPSRVTKLRAVQGNLISIFYPSGEIALRTGEKADNTAMIEKTIISLAQKIQELKKELEAIIRSNARP